MIKAVESTDDSYCDSLRRVPDGGADGLSTPPKDKLGVAFRDTPAGVG